MNKIFLAIVSLLFLSGMRLESVVSTGNSTNGALPSGSTMTGTGESVEGFSAVTTGVLTDQDGTLYMEFSPDNSNWDSSLSYSVSAGVNEVHRLSTSRKYYRTRFTNSATQNQSYLRLQTKLGNEPPLTSPLNSVFQQDADATVVRAISDELSIAEDKMSGYSIVNKFGTNSDLDTGTIPEDIWEGGGLYAGFPDSSLETVSVLSASANDASAGTGARTLRVSGLDTNYNPITEVITLNGATPTASTQLFRRVNTATVLSAGSGGVNAGVLTVRHTTTTANIFLAIPVGRNQSNCSCYTVPAGYTAYMRAMHVSISQSTSAASAEGNIWTRTFGMPFRSRRPFLVSNSGRLYDYIFGGATFTEKSDIVLRINTVSNSNTVATGGFDLILVKN